MAKISELLVSDPAAALDGTEGFHAKQGAGSVGATVEQVGDYVLGRTAEIEALILAAAIAGLSLASSADVADGDSVLEALGKLQAQIDALPVGGDVVGPAGATDGNPALFDGTTGKLLKQVTFATFKASLAIAVADVSGAAPLASPAFTSTPTAPTAAPGTNTTQIATTAFVKEAADNPVGKPFLLIVAVSDESSDLTAGAGKVTFRMPHAVTLTAVRASVKTAPTGGTLLTIDVNDAGSTILSTKLTFDASAKTTVGATTPAVISDASIADDAEITIDIDSVGSTIAGAGLKVAFIGVYA